MQLGRKRVAETNTWTWVAIVLAVVIVLSVGGYISITPNHVGLAVTSVGNTTGAGSGNLCAAALPLQFTVFDGLAGGAINAPTMNIYLGQLIKESPTVSSAGVATTGNSYNTGTNLIIKLSGGTGAAVTEFLPFTVPPITCGSNQSNNIVTIYDVTLGAWTLTATGPSGTTFTSTGTKYLSQFPGGASAISTVSVTDSETTTNAGYLTTVDILNSLVQNFVVQAKDTGTGLSITGFNTQQSVGTTRYFFNVCPDGIVLGSNGGYGQSYTVSGSNTNYQENAKNNPATNGALTYPSNGASPQCQGSLSKQTIGVNTLGGNAYFSFGVSVGSLAAGSNEQIVVSNQAYASLSFFAAQTSLGPNAAAQGSSFTFSFTNA